MMNDKVTTYDHLAEHEISEEPRYRIHKVSEITGLSAPNLRAWERRYGIPQPKRSKNTYRLYSQRDIVLVQKMKSLCEAGHAPSIASKLAQESLSILTKPKTIPSPPILEYQVLIDQIVNAACEFNHQQLQKLLEHSISLGNAWSVYQQILAPSLTAIGDLWETDQSYVAHEHLLSNAIKDILYRLLKILSPPLPRKRILFACIQNELHDIPLVALALRAAHVGCLPVILGANTPPIAIHNALKYNSNLDAVILSATSAYDLYYQSEADPEPISVLTELLNSYDKACSGYTCLIGGRATRSWSYLDLDAYQLRITSDYQILDQLL